MQECVCVCVCVCPPKRSMPNYWNIIGYFFFVTNKKYLTIIITIMFPVYTILLLQVKLRISDVSDMTQWIMLEADSKYIKFDTSVCHLTFSIVKFNWEICTWTIIKYMYCQLGLGISLKQTTKICVIAHCFLEIGE